ncbi:MAG TPA: hypothetical protein VIB39_21835 [Candidatus Angelobacter sp.]
MEPGVIYSLLQNPIRIEYLPRNAESLSQSTKVPYPHSLSWVFASEILAEWHYTVFGAKQIALQKPEFLNIMRSSQHSISQGAFGLMFLPAVDLHESISGVLSGHRMIHGRQPGLWKQLGAKLLRRTTTLSPQWQGRLQSEAEAKGVAL